MRLFSTWSQAWKLGLLTAAGWCDGEAPQPVTGSAAQPIARLMFELTESTVRLRAGARGRSTVWIDVLDKTEAFESLRPSPARKGVSEIFFSPFQPLALGGAAGREPTGMSDCAGL
jgi:hypothetical protein